MYLVDLSDPKYSKAWGNYTIMYRQYNVGWDLDEVLKQINAINRAGTRDEIYFETEEDAVAFILKYS